jgi:hypothetical protein
MKALRIRQAVALEAEAIYPQAVELAGKVAPSFQGDKDDGSGRGQFHRFEALVSSADTVTQVTNYVKRQTARLTAWRQSRLGQTVLCWIEKPEGLSVHVTQVADRVGESLTPSDRLLIRRLLIQEYVRALVAELELRRSLWGG